MSRFLIAGGLIAIVAMFAACEEDGLVPTAHFRPTDCEEDDSCGHTGMLDAGSIPVDGGQLDAGLEDQGVDSGPPDLGPPDLGDPDLGPPDVGDPDLGPPDLGVDAGSPDTGVIPPYLDLTGNHNSSYEFDISNALFGISALGGPLDFLDQAISGDVRNQLSFLGPLANVVANWITNFVDMYIPPWVGTVVGVLNGLAQFFQEIKVTGVMTLSNQVPGLTQATFDGTEVWNTMIVMIISGCDMGGTADPRYPGCAERLLPIASRTMAGPLEVGVDPRPFSGMLDPGAPSAPFRIVNREVDVEFFKLVTLVLDLAVNLATGGQYTTLAAALNAVIDCPNFGRDVADAIEPSDPIVNAIIRNAVENACDSAKNALLPGINNGLAGIPIGWQAMEFDQIGLAVDTNGNGRPERLQLKTVPNTIDGRFRDLTSSDMGGIWEAFGQNP